VTGGLPAVDALGTASHLAASPGHPTAASDHRAGSPDRSGGIGRGRPDDAASRPHLSSSAAH
ncbi:hypothetical protein, partial [Microbacterium sp. K41]|uniref:hypothetical protein n=1 Tax=Microbacterium sp. K41 TaxID=2305437 RepID=UPI00197B957F